ncbi:MAG: glutamine--fructose-6-phosphate transaminase (isomerizing) [Immundisolibacteraceae bacterium]|nr:glutamine--fructose-6-phosphate transaminase (isomerizing) [Immundisolibacteraceae bacterium]
MCGIVCSISRRDVVPQLIEGLRRLEYRGYDSAGIVVLDPDGELQRVRSLGKVKQLDDQLLETGVAGTIGIGHTRWATHGVPSEANAHPHMADSRVAVVHNGIIENHNELRAALIASGSVFESETDTEVIPHLINRALDKGADLVAAVNQTIDQLDGAYSLGIVVRGDKDRLIGARSGSPLVIGVGRNEYFLASDAAAIIAHTPDLIFLEEGDRAEITLDGITIWDQSGAEVERPIKTSTLVAQALDKGGYRHYMLKEIHQQPEAVADTLEGRLGADQVLEGAFGPDAAAIFDQVKAVQIIACGTSNNAGQVARYWMESLAKIPCQVEIASEFRYRDTVLAADTLLVTISQSGETADTLEGLREAKRRGVKHSLVVCNVPESSLVRESELVLMTHAGPEIGVASTKAFTTQLVALMLLTIVLGRRHGLTVDQEAELVQQLRKLPEEMKAVLDLEKQIEALASEFRDKNHALFLGRGMQFPVAQEGALKLKEISYIHAEAYPAGELKHGPLALVDEEMPVVAVAPNDHLLEKLKSNIHEVQARGGRMFVFADQQVKVEGTDTTVIAVPGSSNHLAAVLYTIPLQLLAYYVAVIKGTDVDQPRNLAKSVTVE